MLNLNSIFKKKAKSRLSVKNHNLDYIVKKSNRKKKLTIRISPQSQVIVSCPKFISNKRIDHFIQQNLSWIQQKIKEQQKTQSYFFDQNFIRIFGKKYIKSTDFKEQNSVKTYIQDNQIIISHFMPISKQKQSKTINKYLKSTATRYLIPRTHQMGQKMNIKFNKISIKKQKTRWGSCSSLGNLNFNWRLVHFDIPIIDYVIIHELAHRVHLNHSKTFWSLVGQYCPQYQKHRRFLKKYQVF